MLQGKLSSLASPRAGIAQYLTDLLPTASVLAIFSKGLGFDFENLAVLQRVLINSHVQQNIILILFKIYIQIIARLIILNFMQPTWILDFKIFQYIIINTSGIYLKIMIKTSKLSVTIHDVQFAKDFQYFISVHYEGLKKQTDVSALARNPIFTNNTFFFDPPSNHMLKGNIIFIANMVLSDDEPTHSKNEGGGKSKILGQSALDLTPFGLQPTQTYNLPIRQQLKFLRVKDGKEISVGRFIASFKIVPEEDVPVYMQQLQEKKIQRNQIFNDLPDYDEDLNFKWRAKIDIRQALNIPNLDNLTPQVYVEVGWTQYKDTIPEQRRIYSTAILNTNHPEWNQIFLITNPPDLEQLKGFIYICLKQKNNLQDLSRIYVPIQSMGHFIPYNIKIRESKQNPSPIDFYISLLLQTSSSFKQRLHDIIVADITFDPLVTPSKQINLALTVNPDCEPKVNFLQFSPNEDTIERVLEFDQAKQFTYFLTQTMKVPPIKSSKQYRAACIFTIPQSFLNKDLCLYLVFKKTKASYFIGGVIESIQKDLISLLIQKTKKRVFFSVRASPDIKLGKCQVQISEKQQAKVDTSSRPGSKASSKKGSIVGSRVSRNGEETANQKLMRDMNISSNDSLLKHVNQNNEIIARILRQLDDKSESLKEAASQITDLRSRVKLLQTENSILRRKAMQQEDQLVNLVQKQIDNMNIKQLKQKIIKMSQLYKSQRIKNKDLQKSIKVMQPQVSNTMQLNSVILSQKNNIQALQQKIEKFKKDSDRVTIYKQTIKKQEKVIGKLERVMKDGMEQVRQARQNKLQLEQIKKKSVGYSSSNNSDKQQIAKLQRIIAEMQRNPKSGGVQFSNVSSTSNSNMYELQFKLHQAETRIQSLQRELQSKSKSYARQVAMYKLKIAEKQAILDGFSHNNSYN